MIDFIFIVLCVQNKTIFFFLYKYDICGATYYVRHDKAKQFFSNLINLEFYILCVMRVKHRVRNLIVAHL